jgi:DNA-binding MarR family transcriptional regulator
LLKRERSGGDKRGAYATLTDQSRDALRSAWPIYARGIRDYFACHLSETELNVLAEALRRVYHAAQEIER